MTTEPACSFGEFYGHFMMRNVDRKVAWLKSHGSKYRDDRYDLNDPQVFEIAMMETSDRRWWGCPCSQGVDRNRIEWIWQYWTRR